MSDPLPLPTLSTPFGAPAFPEELHLLSLQPGLRASHKLLCDSSVCRQTARPQESDSCLLSFLNDVIKNTHLYLTKIRTTVSGILSPSAKNLMPAGNPRHRSHLSAPAKESSSRSYSKRQNYPTGLRSTHLARSFSNQSPQGRNTVVGQTCVVQSTEKHMKTSHGPTVTGFLDRASGLSRRTQGNSVKSTGCPNPAMGQ